MKNFLKETVGNDNIQDIELEDLKSAMMGNDNPMATRIKYRK